MALLTESHTIDIGESFTNELNDLFNDDSISLNQLWVALQKTSISQQFNMFCYHAKHGDNHIKDLVAQLLGKCCQNTSWLSTLCVQETSSIVRGILSLSSTLFNKLQNPPKEIHPDFFKPYLFYSLLHDIPIDELPSYLQYFTSFRVLCAGYKLYFNSISSFSNHGGDGNETLSLHVQDSHQLIDFSHLFSLLPLSMTSEHIFATLHILETSPEQLQMYFNSLSNGSLSLSIVAYHDIFLRNCMQFSEKTLQLFVISLCSSPHYSKLLSMIFTLFSDINYIKNTDEDQQHILTHAVVFLLRCIPFSMKTILLTNGVEKRLEAPVQYLKTIAITVAEEIKCHTHVKRKDFDKKFNTSIESISIKDLVKDTSLNTKEMDDLIQETKDQTEGIEELDFTEVKKETKEERQTIEEPMHLIEWLELFEGFETRTYEEVAMMLSIGVELIKKSRSFIRPHIKEVIFQIIRIPNKYQMKKFEEYQIEILKEIMKIPNFNEIEPKQILLEYFDINISLIITTMIAVGFHSKWINFLRFKLSLFCSQNTDLGYIQLCVDYLKDFGDVVVINDWFVLLQTIHDNDSITISLLSALLHMISLIDSDVFVWRCGETAKEIIPFLNLSKSNHPIELVRLLSNSLEELIVSKCSIEIKKDLEKDIVLF
ncbi:Telomere length regulation protein conserved domain-containing protein [Entamoeba marina]